MVDFRFPLADMAWIRFGVLVGAFLCCHSAFAQDPVFDATGLQENRDYISQEPFEHIDTVTGSLVLSFTDLVLPGNAARDLRFTRTGNRKTTGHA